MDIVTSWRLASLGVGPLALAVACAGPVAEDDDGGAAQDTTAAASDSGCVSASCGDAGSTAGADETGVHDSDAETDTGCARPGCGETETTGGDEAGETGSTCEDGVRNGEERGVDCGGPQCPACADAPPWVIFDTDMGPDIDDALALAMLHSYADDGLIELAAVTISRNSTWGAKFSDALNTYYGRPEIPIGIYAGTTGAPQDMYATLADNYPHDVDDAPIPEGYAVQRQVLVDAAAQGRTVIVIQVGFSGNLSTLVDSGPDEISDDSGEALVSASVSLLSIMAGNFDATTAEFNIANDLPSALNLFAAWPVAMTVSGWQVGGHIHYPYAAIMSELAPEHPVRAAYEFADLSWHQDAPPYYNMKTWDLTSVLEALEPEPDLFSRSEPGLVTLDAQGVSSFAVQAGGLHRRLASAAGTTPADNAPIVDRMIARIQ